MNKTRNLVIIILIFGMTVIIGCSGGSEKKPSNSSDQRSKAPTELKNMSTELDSIISELDKKIKQQNMPLLQQNIQLNPQEKDQSNQAQTSPTPSSQQQNGETQVSSQSQNSQSQSGQNQSSGTTQSQGSQTQEQAADWQKEFNSLKNLHTSWNSLMPEAIEAGMSIDARSQFEKALEQLTQQISQQKPEGSLSAALMVYKNYADMTQFFTNSVPAVYYQVKYEIMAAIFESSQNNWSTAEQHAAKIKEHWIYLAAQAKDVDSKILSRMEFGISDLEQAIKSKQADLVMIKGEIAMTNLKNLEDKLAAQ